MPDQTILSVKAIQMATAERDRVHAEAQYEALKQKVADLERRVKDLERNWGAAEGMIYNRPR